MKPDSSDGTVSTTVERKLRRAWRKERRFHHGNGLAHFVVWALALVLLDLLVDWLFLVPGFGRMALLAVNVVTLGWVLYHYWLSFLKPYDPVIVALQVERRHPELQSMLVSYVQFAGETQSPAYASPGLVRALQRQTIEASRPIDFREIVSYRELRRITSVSVCVIVFFALYSVNWSEHLRVLFCRLTNPRAEIEYPTRTQIEWITGDVTMRQGASVTIGVRAGGVIPANGTLYMRPQSGEWEKLAIFPGPDQDFAYRFREVFHPFEYYVRLGDACSKRHEVIVVPPPRIVESRVHLRYPAYTRRTPKTVDFLNLEVPEGTEVEWELTCDKPLDSAQMLIDETETRQMGLEATLRAARLATRATQSFTYQFIWKDREYGYDHEDEVHYFVQVTADQPPQVEIVAPTEDGKATVRKTLTVSYLARDDYAVGEAWLVYSLNDGEERRRSIGKFDEALVKEQTTWKIAEPESMPGLKVGDVVTYAIEVRDNHTGDDGPHLNRSESRRLFIVSVPDYLRHVFEQRQRLRTELEAMREDEKEAEAEVGTLKEESNQSRTTDAVP